MNTKAYTENPEILDMLHLLDEIRGREFSDIIDAEGNQYIDLVMEGGGTLGIGLLGYIYILEQMNIRFMKIAGASAGSVVTLMLTCGPINEAKTIWMLKELDKINFLEFIDFRDGDNDAERLINLITKEKTFIERIKNVWRIIKLSDNFLFDALKHKGIAVGNKFHQWLIETIRKKNVKTLADLKALRSPKPDGFTIRESRREKLEVTEEDYLSFYDEFVVIAADITTETRVKFPEMAELYWENPDEVNPADFVRASMSIPMLFEPYCVKGIKHNIDNWKKWNNVAKYKGEVPNDVYFVDGGVVSNFPIDIFHRKNLIPLAPTFGVKLGADRQHYNKINNISNFLMATFNTARNTLDNDFLFNNEDFKKIVKNVDIGQHNWLNFKLTLKEKVDLFIRGARAATEFLKEFNWKKYKSLRNKIYNTSIKFKQTGT